TDVHAEFLSMTPDGELTIRAGYAWDGPSGPAIDTANFMRGSLVHDALYQLIRERYLSIVVRDAADSLLRDICREDGMSRLRAWWVYRAVSRHGEPSADPARNKPVREAP
ncbi:MAG TPA: DUF1353 domain-containing protein, partial [Candidatus Binatia bacterium]|nr:DUF1353 domain-containing protein [Candidatus Binatia bacterium]